MDLIASASHKSRYLSHPLRKVNAFLILWTVHLLQETLALDSFFSYQDE